MRKAEISTDGLRVLRDHAEGTLGEWANAEARGSPLPPIASEVRAHLREAVREAGARLAESDRRTQAHEVADD